MLQRREKARPDLQAEGINENNQSEILGEGQHVFVHLYPQMSRQYPGEEYERNA